MVYTLYYCRGLFRWQLQLFSLLKSSQCVEESATEGGAICCTVIDWHAPRENQVHLISLLQFQNHRVGDVFVLIISGIPVFHDDHVVKMYSHTCSALTSTQHGELEIVDTLDRCGEETYRKSLFVLIGHCWHQHLSGHTGIQGQFPDLQTVHSHLYTLSCCNPPSGQAFHAEPFHTSLSTLYYRLIL